MIQVNETEQEGYHVYEIGQTNAVFFRIGFKPVSLISKSLYFWFEPVSRFPVSALREFKERFEEYFAGFSLVCNVDSTNKTNVRFANFFGFRVAGQQGPILIMRRDM